MIPCHVAPFVRSPAPATEEPPRERVAAEQCDYCGSTTLEWRKCKLICTNCRQINKSCADL
jgi:hypothetical protein